MKKNVNSCMTYCCSCCCFFSICVTGFPRIQWSIVLPTPAVNRWNAANQLRGQISRYWRGWYCWWFKNPANQLRLAVEIPLFTEFYTSKRWLGIGFLHHESTVWVHSLDFFPGQKLTNNRGSSVEGSEIILNMIVAKNTVCVFSWWM